MYTTHMNNIESQLTDMFHKYDAMARAMYPAYAAKPVPSLAFFTKGRMNGWARQIAWRIELNTHVATQLPEAFENTVSHEIAHMVDYAIRGRSGHDRSWKAIHRSLGGTGKRCTQYTGATRIAGRVTNQYLYRNAAGAEIWVGPRHHASLIRGKYTYIQDAKGNKVSRTDWTGISRKKA